MTSTNLAGGFQQNFNSDLKPGTGTDIPLSENVYIKAGKSVTNYYDFKADKQENIPVIGGLMADATRLEGEIKALPLNIAGAEVYGLGVITEKGGNIVGGAYKGAGNLLEKAGDAQINNAENFKDKVETVASKMENVPIFGGLAADATRFGAEIVTIDDQIRGNVLKTAGEAYQASGNIIDSIASGAGNFLKKL